jgi:twitching motility protein PilT
VNLREAILWHDDAHARVLGGASVDTASEIDGVARVRVHVYATEAGVAAAVRLLPRTPPSLASLQLPVAIDDLAFAPHGLVLVCGATGSGKSTTLAALAQEALRRRSIMLVTLEDPIEFALASSGQSLLRRRLVGRDTPDFASGLRDALREDPDVMLVGEMRDAETIALALTAAETGHLVLASIHSRSAASAIERIVDSYPAERQGQIRVQLADSLRAIVAQRLVPKARGGGRIVAVEVLRGTHAVASLIREGKSAQIATLIQSGRKEGMLSLERSLADRVIAGEIRPDDARAAANDASSLAMYLAK